MNEADESQTSRKAQRKLERKNEKKRLREAEVAGGTSEQVEAHVTFEEPVVVAQTRPKQKGTSSSKVKKNMFVPIAMDRSAINLTRETIDDDDDIELVLIQVPSSMEPQAALCNHGLGEKLREVLLSMTSSSSSNSGGNISSSTKTKSSHFELLSAPLRIEAASTADCVWYSAGPYLMQAGGAACGPRMHRDRRSDGPFDMRRRAPSAGC